MFMFLDWWSKLEELDKTHKRRTRSTCKHNLIWDQTLKFVALTAPPCNRVFNLSVKKMHISSARDPVRPSCPVSCKWTDDWEIINNDTHSRRHFHAVNVFFISSNRWWRGFIILLSLPCCVRQTQNDSLSSFVIIYISVMSLLHNKDHLQKGHL